MRQRRQKRDNHYNMGCVYRECGLFGQAEKAFLAALELDPDDPGTHYNLGVLYEDDLKNAARARRHYEYFLQLAPGDLAAPEVRTWLMAL